MNRLSVLLMHDGAALAPHLRVLGGLGFLLFLFAGGDGQSGVQASFLAMSLIFLGASEWLPGLSYGTRRRHQAVMRRAQPPGLINWPEKPSTRGSSRGGRPGEPRRSNPRSRPRTRPAAPAPA